MTTRTRVQGFAGSETADGELFGREVLLVVHPECYMATAPEELDLLLERGLNLR